MTEESVDDVVRDILDDSTTKGLPIVREWLSTGCTVLDLALAGKYPGGLPVGRVSHILGAESSCKTVLAALILGSAQRNGFVGHYADIEGAFDAQFAHDYYGIDVTDTKTFRYAMYDVVPQDVESLFDAYLPMVLGLLEDKKSTKKKPPKSVVVIDSLSALPAAIEVATKLADKHRMTPRAALLSEGFRKIIRPLIDANCTAVFIDQTRDNVGVMFGEKKTVSGGNALKFYSSTRIQLTPGMKIVDEHDIVVGVWVNFRVIKNKIAAPFAEGSFRILFQYGLDNITTSLFYLSVQQNGKDKAKNKTTKIKLFGEEKMLSTWVKHIEKGDLESDLDQAVVETWDSIHKPEERKPRKWS